MMNGVDAFGSSISEEINGMFVEERLIGFAVHYICSYGSYLMEGTVVEGGIDLHSSSVDHGAKQCIFFNDFLA